MNAGPGLPGLPGPRRRPAATDEAQRPADGTAGNATDAGAVAPSVPAQRTAADVYRVSEDQVHRARMAVARNASDSDDCRELLDMLGLIGEGDEPPPVRR